MRNLLVGFEFLYHLLQAVELLYNLILYGPSLHLDRPPLSLVFVLTVFLQSTHEFV